MYLVAVADTHFHNWREFSDYDDDTGNTRLTDQLNAFQEAYDLARKKDTPLIIAGDLFHERQAVDTRVYNAVYEFMQKNSDVKVMLIPGNHDKVSNQLEASSSVDTFGYIPNVEVFTEMTHTEIDSEDMPSPVGVTFIPYGDEVDEIKEFIQNVELTYDTNILVAHLGVDGSETGGSNHRLGGAFSYQDLRPDDYDVILLGHYHKGQILNTNPNHRYIGSLTQNNFGESSYTPGHVLVDFTGDEIISEKIANNSTRFITIESGNEPENLEELIETHYVRFNTDKAGAKALEDTGADLTNVRINATEEATVETRIDIENETSPYKITEKYMDEFYPDAKPEALEIIQEVLNTEG